VVARERDPLGSRRGLQAFDRLPSGGSVDALAGLGRAPDHLREDRGAQLVGDRLAQLVEHRVARTPSRILVARSRAPCWASSRRNGADGHPLAERHRVAMRAMLAAAEGEPASPSSEAG
jgi:hypothetical protein